MRTITEMFTGELVESNRWTSIRHRVPWLGVLLTAWVFASAISAAEPTENEEPSEIARLARDLASPDFATRERAHRELLQSGEAAERALVPLLESPDVEQRLRAQQILQEIRKGRLWKPSLVNLKRGDMKVLQVYEELAAQSGNPINWDRTPKTFDPLVSVDWENVPYWVAMEQIGQQAQIKAQFFDDPQRAGVKLTPGVPDSNPAAYVGPLRLTVQSLRSSVSKSLNYADGLLDRQEQCNLSFALHWEQRFQLSRYNTRPRILEARTDAGENLAMDSGAPTGTMPVTRRQRQIVVSSRLRPAAIPAKALTSLVVALELTASDDFRSLLLPLSEPAARSTDFGYEFELVEIQEKGTTAQYTIRWTRPVPYDKMNRTDMIDEYLEVLDDAGNLMPFNQVQVIGEKLSVLYKIEVSSKAARPATLRYNVALLQSTRTVEFQFKDVPLP